VESVVLWLSGFRYVRQTMLVTMQRSDEVVTMFGFYIVSTIYYVEPVYRVFSQII